MRETAGQTSNESRRTPPSNRARLELIRLVAVQLLRHGSRSGDHAKLVAMARRVASLDGRYEPHETPPVRRALATATQLALMLVPRMILLPLLVVTVAGGRSALESRVVLASLVVCSLLMLLTTVGFGRLRTENLCVAAVDPIRRSLTDARLPGKKTT